MLEKYLTYINTALLVIILVLPFVRSTGLLGATPLGTATTYNDLNVDSTNGVGHASYAVNGVLAVASSGSGIAATVTTLNATTSITVNGVNVAVPQCVSTGSFNPGSLTTSTIGNTTSTDIALAGAALGDKCIGSLNSATSSAIDVFCNITGTATATLSVMNTGITNAAIDLANGSTSVCYIH